LSVLSGSPTLSPDGIGTTSGEVDEHQSLARSIGDENATV
jgi:hypothetical protein